LVNHPVDLFWKRFLVNFVREIWALEIRVRLGLFMLIAGLCIRCLLYSIWYILYPRVAILSVILIGSIIYLDPFDVQRQLRAIVNIIVSPDKALQAIEQLDLSQLRILTFSLFLIPTMLEIRTLAFLSQIKAEVGWTMYNMGIGGILLATMLSLYNLKGMKPRECSYQGMLILYGSALVITVVTWDLRRIPLLAAPFLTATGTLLLTYQDDDMEWLPRIVRHTLRLTLRDVLSSVGERVAEDEMLQLAILRWICDFWANNHETPEPSSSASAARPPPSGTTTTRPQAAASPSSQSPRPSGTAPNVGVMLDQDVPFSPPSQGDFHLRDIQWEELLPMLNIEISHMEAEVEVLQSENRPRSQTRNNSFDTSRNNSRTGQTGRTNQTPSEQPDMQSFWALKSMLLSLNVDDKAKPAVQAYRRAVESFPPAKRRAVAISVIRRCPAMVTLMLHVFFGGPRTLFTSFVILVPFIVMEYLRIISWIESCRRVAAVSGFVPREEPEGDNTHDWGIPQGLENVDTMVILLCGDGSTLRPPTLLLVWQNIVGSVKALEVGLTTARCAETTAVAVDFAGNVMDLVQFGLEVSQQGLLHGLMVMAKEAISIHTTGADLNNLHNIDYESARFTRAAMRAVHSGQRVARNMHLLSEDEHVGTIVQPLLMTLGFLAGQGWLWGRDIGGEDTSTEDTSTFPGQNAPADENKGGNVDLNQTTPHTKSEAPAKQDDVAGTVMQGSQSPSESSLKPTDDIPKDSDHEDLIPPLSSPRDDLSEVMEMVSRAYEQALIDVEEKNDFYERLSRLQVSELLDESVVSGMKRTLMIILENGCMVSVQADAVDDDTLASLTVNESVTGGCRDSEQSNHVACDIANHDQSGLATTDDSEHERCTRDSTIEHNPNIIAFDARSETVNASQESHRDETSSDDRNGAFVKLGVAALGVVAGGLLLSMRGRNGNDDNANSTDGTPTEDGQERNELATIEIEELPDDREDDWVSVAQ
jgi:hypothetical protein